MNTIIMIGGYDAHKDIIEIITAILDALTIPSRQYQSRHSTLASPDYRLLHSRVLVTIKGIHYRYRRDHMQSQVRVASRVRR